MRLSKRNTSTEVLIVLLALTAWPASAGEKPAVGQLLVSPLSREDLDRSVFAQWVDGEEKSLEIRRGPSFIMWTKNSRIEWSGMYYADSKKPGVRHMRIGWKRAKKNHS